MGTLSIKPNTPNFELPSLQVVEPTRPFLWLRAGWSDLVHAWPASLGMGALFALLGYALRTYVWPQPHFALTLMTGFLLIAPFMAIVLYEISRRREKGTDAGSFFESARANPGSIGLFAALLAFILSSWERLSAILVALFFENGYIGEVPLTLPGLFASAEPGFLITYSIVGGALAALVFALSAVSLPMMMDRKTDIATAIVTSLWVVRSNPAAMLVWATLIAVSTALSMLLWMIPLLVVFPLLGHATWHAYRDLVGE